MKRKIEITAITLVAIALVIFIVRSPVLKDAASILFLSAIIAYCLKPLQLKLIERGVSKKISCILLLLFMFFIVGLIIFSLVPQILKDIMNISSNLSQVKEITDRVNRFMEKYIKNTYARELFDNVSLKFQNRMKAFGVDVVDGILKKGDSFFSLAVLPIVVYYFLTDGKNLSAFVMTLVPMKKRRILRNFLQDINVILSRYVVSQFLLSFLIVLMTFLILILFKIKFPLLLSLLNGIFNIIPYFGPIFGAVPILIVGVLNAPRKIIWLIICLNLIQQIEGDILAPKITGDSVDIHPLAIIILLIIGGKLGGIFGMVLAVPIAVALKVIKEDIDYYMY